MNVPLVVAGSLGLLGAAIHGGVGDLIVVRRLTPEMLPASPFGGPGITKLMIRVAWHITTIAFVTVGSALLLAGSYLRGDVAHAIGLLGALASTGVGAIILGGFAVNAPRSLRSSSHRDRIALLHPGPMLALAITVLAWWGIT